MLNHSTGSSEAGRQGESPAGILSRGGDTHDPGILDRLPSASLTGQELDLVAWGHFTHSTLLGSLVDVLGGHGVGHGEVLEGDGEEEQ